MNIVQIIGSLRVGGAEKQFVHLSNELCKNNNLYIVVLSDAADDAIKSLVDKRIKTTIIKSRLIYFPIVILKLVLFFVKNKIDVVHTHMFWASFYGIFAAKIARVKTTLTSEHGMNPWKKTIHHFIEKWLSSLCTVRVCVSKDIAKNRLLRDGFVAEKTVVIPNGVPQGEYLPRSWGKTLNLISVGRFIEAKDYPTLLLTIKKLTEEENIVIHLTIVGDGPLQDKMQCLINEYKLNEFVSLVGKKSNPLQWLKKSDVFIMSSIREGQPMALLEAMSTGMPIVSTNVGGIKDTLVNEEDAILVESGNADLLAKGVLRIFFDNEYANILGQSAFNKQFSQFSIESNAAKILKLYQKNNV